MGGGWTRDPKAGRASWARTDGGILLRWEFAPGAQRYDRDEREKRIGLCSFKGPLTAASRPSCLSHRYASSLSALLSPSPPALFSFPRGSQHERAIRRSEGWPTSDQCTHSCEALQLFCTVLTTWTVTRRRFFAVPLWPAATCALSGSTPRWEVGGDGGSAREAWWEAIVGNEKTCDGDRPMAWPWSRDRERMRVMLYILGSWRQSRFLRSYSVKTKNPRRARESSTTRRRLRIDTRTAQRAGLSSLLIPRGTSRTETSQLYARCL